MCLEMLAGLNVPFKAKDVQWRMGAMSNWDKDKRCPKDSSRAVKAQALAYVDVRDVQDRLDAVVGSHKWKNEYLTNPLGGVICRISVNVGTEEAPVWIWKEDGASSTDVEAVKGGLTDAFKRSAVLWGIGRYLYSIDSPWVEVDYSNPQFLKFKENPVLPAWAVPESTSAPPQESIPAHMHIATPPQEQESANDGKCECTEAERSIVDDMLLKLRAGKTTRNTAKVFLGKKVSGAGLRYFEDSLAA